ncbi:MAG: serine/threonine-protein kinase, partial [Candidatus Xenobia bacterium]
MDPQIVDGYTVVGLLGKGGRGTVYKVLHPQTRQPLALKLLRTPELLPLEEQRFAREFNLAASIVHDNVVRVFDVGRWEGSPYYTMELVEGTNLRAWTELQQTTGADRRRWLEHLAQITDQIFNALGCIHEKKIIHRDLKPENIIIAAGPIAKIVDFGLAKVKAADQRLTGRGEVIGTASYAAPEILLRQEVDSRADLYAMGVILYECISGRVLFEGEEALGTLAQILYQDPSPLRTYAPDIPAELEAAIMKLLRKDPWDRTGTANEARQELAAGFRKLAGVEQPAMRGGRGGVAVGPPPAPHVHSTSDIFEPRMVGRNVHLEMLLQVVEEARRGEFRLIKIHGESGVGKSRLLTEFVRRATQKGHQAVWSRV